MLDRISEMLELLLVNLGMALTRLSDEQIRRVTLFLASLLVAAMAASVLRFAVAH
jgi:hypothetical protein